MQPTMTQNCMAKTSGRLSGTESCSCCGRRGQLTCRWTVGFIRRWTAYLLWALWIRIYRAYVLGRAQNAHAWFRKRASVYRSKPQVTVRTLCTRRWRRSSRRRLKELRQSPSRALKRYISVPDFSQGSRLRMTSISPKQSWMTSVGLLGAAQTLLAESLRGRLPAHLPSMCVESTNTQEHYRRKAPPPYRQSPTQIQHRLQSRSGPTRLTDFAFWTAMYHSTTTTTSSRLESKHFGGDPERTRRSYLATMPNPCHCYESLAPRRLCCRGSFST